MIQQVVWPNNQIAQVNCDLVLRSTFHSTSPFVSGDWIKKWKGHALLLSMESNRCYCCKSTQIACWMHFTCRPSNLFTSPLHGFCSILCSIVLFHIYVVDAQKLDPAWSRDPTKKKITQAAAPTPGGIDVDEGSEGDKVDHLRFFWGMVRWAKNGWYIWVGLMYLIGVYWCLLVFDGGWWCFTVSLTFW
jgi:hypothetical protein